MSGSSSTVPLAAGELAVQAGRTERNVRRALVWLTLAAVFVGLAMIVWTLNRGFDWSDEGFVYTMIEANRVSTREFWGFQHLLHPVYDLFGSSVLAFRTLRLLGYVTLGAILTLVTKRALGLFGLSLRRLSWVLVAAVAQVGTLAAWSYPPRYLGYNELSSWFAQVGGALLLLVLFERIASSSGRGLRRTSFWLWLSLGAIIVILFFAKFTAAILLGGLTLVVFCCPTSASRWKQLGAAALGAISLLLLLAATGVPLIDYTRAVVRLALDPSAQAESGYPLSSLINVYLQSLALTVRTLALPAAFTAVVFIAAAGFAKNTGMRTKPRLLTERTAVAFMTLTSLLLVLPSALTKWDSLGMTNAFMLVFALLAFMILTPARIEPFSAPIATRMNLSAAVLIFAFAPFVSGFGTTNALVGQTVFAASLWAAGAGVAGALLLERATALTASARLAPLALIAVVAASATYAVSRDIAEPYRSSPLYSQDSLVGEGHLRGIHLTAEQARLHHWLHTSGDSLSAKRTPAVSVASPGALLAFNASDWVNSWTGPGWDKAVAEACGDGVGDLYVLQSASETNGTGAYDQLVAGLGECGIDFPRDFQLVDRHESVDPALDVTIWSLRL